LENLFFIIVFALGASIIVFVSQNYGAKRIDRIRRCIPESIKIIFPIVLCITLILKFKSVWLISLFTTDQGVITVGADVLSFLSLWYLTYTAIEVLGNVITGCGKPHYSMITTLLFVCTLRIIYSFISIKLNFTLKQLVFAYPLSWIVNTICLAIITHKVLKELENSLENEE
jgi:Na+-driven multidrug efflux pump